MTKVVIDDHLLREVLTGDRSPEFGGVTGRVVATGGAHLHSRGELAQRRGNPPQSASLDGDGQKGGETDLQRPKTMRRGIAI